MLECENMFRELRLKTAVRETGMNALNHQHVLHCTNTSTSTCSARVCVTVCFYKLYLYTPCQLVLVQVQYIVWPSVTCMVFVYCSCLQWLSLYFIVRCCFLE